MVRIVHLVGLYRLVDGALSWCAIVDGTPTRPDTGEIAEVSGFARDAIPGRGATSSCTLSPTSFRAGGASSAMAFRGSTKAAKRYQ
ncbi:MAG: hypothetical protein ACR2M2_08860 [Gaiellaceae bacterium]